MVKPANAGLRLFGGAAFERVLAEFQEAAKLLEFPSVQRDRVANILLAYKSRWVGGCLGNGRLWPGVCAHSAGWHKKTPYFRSSPPHPLPAGTAAV